MFNNNGNPLLTNCIFEDNRANTSSSSKGAGFYTLGASTPVLDGCVFEANMAFAAGGGIMSLAPANPVISRTQFCQNSPDDISGDWTDAGTTFFLKFCVSCTGDVDGDLNVGINDFLAVLAAWGPCNDCYADVDDSGAVDIIDFLIVLGAWGSCI